MHTKCALAILVVAASLVIAMVPMAVPVSAEDHARGGLDKADKNVHDNTGGLSDQDIRFHEGTCQGGHSTTVLDNLLGGCDNVPPPGGK